MMDRGVRSQESKEDMWGWHRKDLASDQSYALLHQKEHLDIELGDLIEE